MSHNLVETALGLQPTFDGDDLNDAVRNKGELVESNSLSPCPEPQHHQANQSVTQQRYEQPQHELLLVKSAKQVVQEVMKAGIYKSNLRYAYITLHFPPSHPSSIFVMFVTVPESIG